MFCWCQTITSDGFRWKREHLAVCSSTRISNAIWFASSAGHGWLIVSSSFSRIRFSSMQALYLVDILLRIHSIEAKKQGNRWSLLWMELFCRLSCSSKHRKSSSSYRDSKITMEGIMLTKTLMAFYFSMLSWDLLPFLHQEYNSANALLIYFS